MADNSSNKPRNTEKPFLNPYNFVTLKKTPAIRGIISEDGTITGELKCKIKTKTRFFVPESQPDREENGHKYYAFMKNEKGECIIPGSSLRGVLRSAYETATDSCFSTLKNTKYLSSRYKGDNKLTPGLLIKKKENGEEKWVLYNAKEYLLLANIKDEKYDDEDCWKAKGISYLRIREHKLESKREFELLDKKGYKKYSESVFKNKKSEIKKNKEKVYCDKNKTVYRNTVIVMKSDGSLQLEDLATIKRNKENNGSAEEDCTMKTGDLVLFSVFDEPREVRPKVKKEMVSMIKKPTSEDDNNSRLKKGYLVIGEQGDEASSKHYCRVFEKKDSVEKIGKKAMDRYIEQIYSLIGDYCDQKINKKYRTLKEGNRHRGYKYLLNKDVIPVMYEKDEKSQKYYFQFATMGRRVYDKKLEDFADDIHKPCKTKESLCPACTLFGMIGKDEKTKSALGSRIRISDAKAISSFSLSEDTNKWDRLSILSNPHIYLPFFQDEVNETQKKDIFNENYEGKGISLKGRKFYLHTPADDKYFKRINTPDGAMSDQNITAQTIGKDTEFSFSVYFEKLTEKELRTLIRTINLGENDINGKYCHKIGHGKSIGMGSAKIIVEEVTERSFIDGKYKVVNRNETRLCDLDNDEDTLISADYYKSLKEICDFNKIAELYNNGIDVHYPGTDEETENGFEWFALNAKAANQNETKNDDWQTLTDFSEIYNADNPLEGKGRKAKVLYTWKK